VTVEGTASCIISASVLARARLQMGQCGTGTFHFGEEKFPVQIIVDTVEPSDPFIELTHQTRDDCEGGRIVRDRIRLIWTVPTSRPMAGDAGGSCVRGPVGARRSFFCRTADGISGADKLTALVKPASVMTSSVVYKGEPQS